MALDITENLKQELRASSVKPILVLKIDGYDNIFNNTSIKSYIKIGEPGLKIGMPLAPSIEVWKIGGYKYLANQSPYISFNIGTTTKITQKIDPSRGLGSSVSQMNIAIVDVNGEITKFASPGFVLDDLLGRRVSVYSGVENSSFPLDYNVIFRGNIQDINAQSGAIVLSLNNTEERKRQEIVPKIKTELIDRVNYRSLKIYDLFYMTLDDYKENVVIEYVSDGSVVGEPVVSVVNNVITVRFLNATASAIKKAIENNPSANQMVELKNETEDEEVSQGFGSFNLVTDYELSAFDLSGFYTETTDETLTTYISIGEELIRYKNIVSGIYLTDLMRSQNNSIPSVHNAESKINRIVRLKGNGIELILKLLLSNGPEFFIENLNVDSINVINSETEINNSLYFADINIEEEYGVSRGDFVTIDNAANPSNNKTAMILEIGLFGSSGSYIILSESLISEPTTSATINIKSQFNVLPFGVGFVPNEVDVKQHLFIRDTFLPNVELDLIADSIPNGKEFIEQEFYLPLGCYSVPRKGRSSIVYQSPPLPNYEVVTLNLRNVVNPSDLVVRRSMSENFFNEVIFNYNYDIIKNEYARNLITSSSQSKSRINVGSKPFTITSKALRSSSGADEIASQSSNRYLRRYQFGAEFIKGIKVLYGQGYQIEIGDVVNVDYGNLKLSNFSSGTRTNGNKLMEVLNKTVDSKTGEIVLDVVNTIFGVNDRLGLISPSSMTGSGSTFNKLIIVKSFSTQSYERESMKWTTGGYVGQMITVRNEDYTESYNTIIRGFDNNDPQGMLVDPLPVEVGENFIIENPRYPDSEDPEELLFWKSRHAYFSPQVKVVNSVAISPFEFEVSPSDADKFFIGSEVLIHDYGYVQVANETTVSEINGNIIKIKDNAGFGIDENHFVDLIGFKDKTSAYRII